MICNPAYALKIVMVFKVQRSKEGLETDGSLGQADVLVDYAMVEPWKEVVKKVSEAEIAENV